MTVNIVRSQLQGTATTGASSFNCLDSKIECVDRDHAKRHNSAQPRHWVLNTVTSILICVLVNSVVAANPSPVDPPSNLAEAHEKLSQRLSTDQIDRIKRAESADGAKRIIDLSQASALTNEWQLWSATPLSRYFRKMGVSEPHDMIGIIVETYWCKLHNKPFRLNSRFAKVRASYARALAREAERRPRGKSPRDGGEIDWFWQEEGPSGTLYLGVNLTDGSFWRFDKRTGKGITPATPDEARKLAELIQVGKEVDEQARRGERENKGQAKSPEKTKKK